MPLFIRNILDGSSVVNVVVADDHDLIREGIVAVISRQPGFHILGCARDASAAFALVARHRPEIIVLDVHLGGHNGASLVHDLTNAYPRTRVIALSAYEEQTSAQRFFSAGAMGFLTKSVSAADLVAALETVASGNSYSSARKRESIPVG